MDEKTKELVTRRWKEYGLVMSQDSYQLDIARHGGPHVDRYNKNSAKVGRYRLDKTPIKHKAYPTACAVVRLLEI